MADLRNTIAHILEHKQHLVEANEATIQQYVVLPILRALGWDDASLASMEIIPEYRVENRRPDYALHVKQEQDPVALIECKRWDQPIGKNEGQICFYAYSRNVPLAIITNGKLWRFYLSRWEASSLSDRIFCETDIENRENAVTDLEKYLLKSNVASEEAELNAYIALEEKENSDSSKSSPINPKVDHNNDKTNNELAQTATTDTLKLIPLLGTGVWTAAKVRDSADEKFMQRCESKYPEEIYKAFYQSSADLINLIVKEEWKLKLRFRSVVNSLFGVGFFLGYRGVLRAERPFGLILSGENPLEIFVRIMEEEAEQLRHQHGCEFCRISKHGSVHFVYYRVPKDVSELFPVLEFAYNKHRRK